MLEYQNENLYMDNLAVSMLAKEFGTPCFIYSKSSIYENYHRFSSAFTQRTVPTKIYYAVKANSNLAILRLLKKLGSGFDCVSAGEIARAIKAGATPGDIIFSGVGKSYAELNYAINLGIHSINIESNAELDRIAAIAIKLRHKVRVALRINPDVSAKTHDYISTGEKHSKFGIDMDESSSMLRKLSTNEHLLLAGLSFHIGSQICTLKPFITALDRLLYFIDTEKCQLEFINIGGGLGIQYKNENPPLPCRYANAILDKIGERNISLHIEPGRAIIANAGILVTKVEYLKKNFAIVDAAMNDIIRPSLYDSYHDIIPALKRKESPQNYDIVGPICESGDFLGKNRVLSIQAEDLLVIKSCGAYCSVASSNYNTRPRLPEVLLANGKPVLIRKRETIEQLWENELCDV